MIVSIRNSALVTLSLISALVRADGGSGTTGGGYMDFNGKKILKAAVQKLEATIPVIKTPALGAHPERRETILQALSRLEVRSQEVRMREGQKLVMDFDASLQLITALQPFFEGFQTTAVSPESVRSAEKLVIHEIAHLWGDDDEAADRFSDEILAAVYPPEVKVVDPRCPADQFWVEMHMVGGGGSSLVGGLYDHREEQIASEKERVTGIYTWTPPFIKGITLRSGWKKAFCLKPGTYYFRFEFGDLDDREVPTQLTVYERGKLIHHDEFDPKITTRGLILRMEYIGQPEKREEHARRWKSMGL